MIILNLCPNLAQVMFYFAGKRTIKSNNDGKNRIIESSKKVYLKKRQLSRNT